MRWEAGVLDDYRHEHTAANVSNYPVTPPALANGKVFVGTRYGRLACLSGTTGEIMWTAEIGEPVVSQPAVVRGRVYICTTSGSLVSIETGDLEDDGWAMWGADSQHSGIAPHPAKF